jgi:hypothetical protein
MLQIQVMYFIWISQAWKIIATNFGKKSSIESSVIADSVETMLRNVEYITNKF